MATDSVYTLDSFASFITAFLCYRYALVQLPARLFVACLGLLLDRLACFIIALFACRILGLLLAIRSCVITVK